MTNTKKVLVTSIILMLLITAGIGTASAAVNIWGADSSDANSQTNAPDYNQKVAEDAKWYYDSEHNILWTPETDIVLPVYLNVTDSTNIVGYNFTFEGAGTGTVTTISAAKGTYSAANEINGAKISASISLGNATAITSAQEKNIANATITVNGNGNYSVKLIGIKLATTDADYNAITSPSDLQRAEVANKDNYISFRVMEKPYVSKFTIAGSDSRNNTTSAVSDTNTLYYYAERDGAAGALPNNEINALIENYDADYDTSNFKWTKTDITTDLAMVITTSENLDMENKTAIISLGAKDVDKYAESTLTLTLGRTGLTEDVKVRATYWNQSAAPTVTGAETVTGTNISLTYKAAKVPKTYVEGAGGIWDTGVELYKIGVYQNYTIYKTVYDTNEEDYVVDNSTGVSEIVKNFTIRSTNDADGSGSHELTFDLGLNGDSNEDDTVDIIDGAVIGIESIKEASSATTILNVQQKFLADTDKNGIVNVNDVLSIHEYIVAP